jgi:hypothetical protein
VVEAGDCPVDRGCVLKGIEKHARLLRSGADDQERAEGLLFLGHWVGDIHQPLHISYANDGGGNSIPVESDFYPDFVDDMHALWDTGIVLRAMGNLSEEAFADRLKGRITAEQEGEWRRTTSSSACSRPACGWRS